jgi:3-hydroxyisobutyrate dehydrogenase
MTNQAKPTVGWLGTGRMGFELAVRLLNSGTSLKVWNRTRSKAEPLASLGATIVDRPADLADCDIVFSIVSSSEVFLHVTLGEGGLFTVEGTAPSLIVDSSTISADASEQVRQAADKRGCQLLAAPVSGSPKVIRSGRLGVVASGFVCRERDSSQDEDHYQRQRRRNHRREQLSGLHIWRKPLFLLVLAVCNNYPL